MQTILMTIRQNKIYFNLVMETGMRKLLLQRKISGNNCAAYLCKGNTVICEVAGEKIDIGVRLSNKELQGDCTLALECILMTAYEQKVAKELLRRVEF